MITRSRIEENRISPSRWFSPKRCLLQQDLLGLLQLLDEAEGHVEHLRHNIGGCQSQPLSQGDVGDAVRLVNLDPDEVLGLRGVLNVVARSPYQRRPRGEGKLGGE